MESIDNARLLVNAVLSELGVDEYEARVDRNRWIIPAGDTAANIIIVPDDDNPDGSTIVVACLMMKVPLPKALAFYRALLERNEQLLGRLSFSVDSENTVWLNSGRAVEGLDPSEALTLIAVTANASGALQKELLDEFGAEYAIDLNKEPDTESVPAKKKGK